MEIKEIYESKPQHVNYFTLKGKGCEASIEVGQNPGYDYGYYTISFDAGMLYKSVSKDIDLNTFKIMNNEKTAQAILEDVLNQGKNLELQDWLDDYRTIFSNAVKNALDTSLKKEEIRRIMHSCAEAAWYNKDGDTKVFVTESGKVLTFEGHTYEPSYECFSSTCRITLTENEKETVLFDKTDSNVGPYENITVTTGSVENVEEIIASNKFYEEGMLPVKEEIKEEKNLEEIINGLQKENKALKQTVESNKETLKAVKETIDNLSDEKKNEYYKDPVISTLLKAVDEITIDTQIK